MFTITADKVEEYFKKMSAIADESNGDPEAAHIRADGLLCEILKDIGLTDVVSEFLRVQKWYA